MQPDFANPALFIWASMRLQRRHTLWKEYLGTGLNRAEVELKVCEQLNREGLGSRTGDR